MIEIRKASFFSRDYLAVKKNKVIAEFSRKLWRERAELTVDGKVLKFRRDGILKSTFFLNDAENTIVKVEQPSVIRSRLTFEYDGKDYQLEKKAWYSKTMLLVFKDKQVGVIKRRSIIASGALVDLPESLPDALHVFLGWVVMVRWDDAAAAAAAG